MKTAAPTTPRPAAPAPPAADDLSPFSRWLNDYDRHEGRGTVAMLMDAFDAGHAAALAGIGGKLNLTPTQLRVLRFIVAYRAEHGYAPTYDEIRNEFGVSKTTVWGHLGEMKRKRALTWAPNKARSIRVMPAALALATGSGRHK